MDDMARLEAIVARLPEAERVDVEAWGDEPTFRVRSKNLVFTDQTAAGRASSCPRRKRRRWSPPIPAPRPPATGSGATGWVSVEVGADADEDRWRQVEEWVRTSYSLVAPKSLARIVLAEDGIG